VAVQPTDLKSGSRTRRWADFGGTCLLGEFHPDADLLMPTSTAFGIPKSASYLYGTWRDDDDVMYRALRGVGASTSDFAFSFSSEGNRQLERLDVPMFLGSTVIRREADAVTFTTDDATREPEFRFRHEPDHVAWTEKDVFDLDGRLLGPGLQWYHPWPEGGGCYTATMKYASEGTFLGRRVTGFLGHEIHYMPIGSTWFNTRYGLGMEICWQQIANEYDDGSFVQATFAYGTEGWGFAMLHDEDGAFHATTAVEIDAVVRANGYPQQVDYYFADEHWVWTIDPCGERARTIDRAPLGADGTCRKAGDTRAIVRSMGNSDWWADGRYEASQHMGDANS
jgi:hypothetical protein